MYDIRRGKGLLQGAGNVFSALDSSHIFSYLTVIWSDLSLLHLELSTRAPEACWFWFAYDFDVFNTKCAVECIRKLGCFAKCTCSSL